MLLRLDQTVLTSPQVWVRDEEVDGPFEDAVRILEELCRDRAIPTVITPVQAPGGRFRVAKERGRVDDEQVSVEGRVLCNCLERGLASPPPCPVIRDDVWVQPAPGHEARRAEVHAWAETACGHRQFWLVDHQVRKIAMLAEMAAYGGAATFPVIHAVLPTHNGGDVSPLDSARCLAEIDRLGSFMSERSMVVIVDADSDAVVFVGTDTNSGLVESPKIHLETGFHFWGFDEGGAVRGLSQVPRRPMTSTWLGQDAVVYVLDATGSPLFAARAFVQERDGGDWIFRDEETGATVRHCSPVPGRERMDGEQEPRRMRAEIRPIDINHYVPPVADLRELFEASVQTGRPVHWR